MSYVNLCYVVSVRRFLPLKYGFHLAGHDQSAGRLATARPWQVQMEALERPHFYYYRYFLLCLRNHCQRQNAGQIISEDAGLRLNSYLKKSY